MTSCPNLNISPYKEIVEQYGPGAANSLSVLFDTPGWLDFYSSPNLPVINNLQIVNSTGQTFDVKQFLSERKSLVAQENGIGNSYELESTAQKVADIFNSTNDRSKQFEAVVQKKGEGFTTKLEWRSGESAGKIGPTDKIIFGHPTIGKTFLKTSEQYKDAFISLDDDYAQDIKDFIATHKKPTEDKYQYQERKPQEFIDFTLELFDKAKALAQQEGKMLFTSNNIVLDKRGSDFDKVIDLSKDEFFRRIGERNTTYNVGAWKDQIDGLIGKVHPSKVIKTSGYLSDLLPKAPVTISSLEKSLSTFLEANNITQVDKEEIEAILGTNPVSWSNVLTKMLYAGENKTHLPKEVAYLGFKLLGRRTKLSSQLLGRIHTWEKYPSLYGKYKAEAVGLIPAEQKRWIKEKILSDFLGEVLVNYHSNPASFETIHKEEWSAEDFTMFKRLSRWFNNLLSRLNKDRAFKELVQASNTLVDNILNVGASEYFSYGIQEGAAKVGYEETLAKDPYAKDIVKAFQKAGLLLTGSLAIRKQGSLFRTGEESLHDLDFNVPYSLHKDTSALKGLQKYSEGLGTDVDATLQEVAPLVEKFSWYQDLKKQYPNIQLYSAFYGRNQQQSKQKISVLGVIDGEFYPSSGFHVNEKTGKKVRHEKGEYVAGTGYNVDFFITLHPDAEVQKNGDVQHWKDIFKAKLEMGRQKDMIDHINFTPFDNSTDSPLPIAFSQAPTPGQTTQEVTDNQKKNKTLNTLDRLKTDLQELIIRLQKQVSKSGADKKSKYIAELKKLQESLATLDEAQAISMVVEDVYNRLIGYEDAEDPTKNKKGVLDQMNKVAADVEKGLKDNTLSKKEMLEKVSQLRQFQQYVKDFGELQNLYHLLPGKAEEGSAKWKLDRIRREQEALIKTYESTVKPLMARMISPYLSKKGLKEVMEMKAKIQEISGLIRLAESREDKKAVARLSKQRDLKIKQVKNLLGTEEDLLEAMDFVSSDISMLESLLGSSANSVDSIVAAFTLFIKDIKVQTERAMQKLGIEAYKEVELFTKATGRNKLRPNEFNKGLYEKRAAYHKNEETGQWERTEEMHFVEELDYGKYADEMSKMFRLAETLPDGERGKLIGTWFSQNTQPKPMEEIEKIVNAKKNQVTAGVITQEEYNEWSSRVMKYDEVFDEMEYRYELAQPSARKYPNKAYAELQANPAMKRYYDFLVRLQQEGDKNLPEGMRLGSRLPNTRKSFDDALLDGSATKENSWDRIKYSIMADPLDSDLHYGSDGSVVPMKFTGRIPADEVSLDLLSSVLLFHHAGKEYADNVELVPFYETMKDTIRDRTILETDFNKNTIVRKGAKILGLDVARERTSAVNNAYAQLESFGDSILYGKKEEKQTFEVFGATIDGGKLMDGAMSLASKTQIGGPQNWTKSISNYLAANISISIEAWAKEHLTPREWVRGKIKMTKYLASSDGMKDFTQPVSTSLLGQIFDHWSPIPEGYIDQFGRTLSKSAARRLLSSSSWFFGSKIGEIYNQYAMFLGMLEGIKVKQNGKVISALDAYELDENNQLRLKAGVEWSEEDQRIFKNKLDALSKRLHGNYATFSKPAVSKAAVGRLLMMYKKFLEPAVKRRFGEYKIDHELDSSTQGYYRIFWRNMFTDYKQTLKAITVGLHPDGTTLTAKEIQSLRTAMKEQLFLASMMGLTALLLGMGDDDDELKDSRIYQLALYQTMRQASELALFVPGLGTPDVIRVFSSPSAIFTTVDRFAKLTRAAMPWNWTDTYTTTSKWHHKGDLKLTAAISALLGLNNFDPEKTLDNYRRFSL